MSKIKSALASAGTLATWGALNAFNKVSAVTASEAADSARKGLFGDDEEELEKFDGDTLTDNLRNVFTIIFSVMGIVAVIVIILGGFYFLTSTGDPAKIKKGKDTILWVIVGFVVVLFSFAVVNFILNSIGGM